MHMNHRARRELWEYDDMKRSHPLRCCLCGGRLHFRFGAYATRLGGDYVIVDHAYWQKCASCGEVVTSLTLIGQLWTELTGGNTLSSSRQQHTRAVAPEAEN